jgi:hypothetical protein
MYKRNDYINRYPLQQNWMGSRYTGNPYYPLTPYSNFAPNPLATQGYQPYQFVGPPAFDSNHQVMGYHYPYQPQQNQHYPPYSGSKSSIQSIFQNPLEPKSPYQQTGIAPQPMMYNPYPKPGAIPKPNGGIGSIMNSFKGQDGNIDINKMMNTAGQMMNAVSQVSAMVKGLGGMFKV